MENLGIASQFKPPPPYSVGGYFDIITKEKATEQYFRSFGNVFALNVDDIVRTIRVRPNPAEQAALLDVLESRLRSYGEARGYIDPPKGGAANPGKILLIFFSEDILGLTIGDTVDQKVINEIQSQLRKGIELGLNDRGKSQLKFIKWVWDVVDAKTVDKRIQVILAGSGEQLTKLLLRHQPAILRGMAKRGPIPAIVVNRLRKVIALRLAWRVTLATRFAWVNPVVLALDLLLTPSEIGSDEKLAFLGVYTQVCEDRRILQSTILERCTPQGWNYKMDPVVVLRSVIQSG